MSKKIILFLVAIFIATMYLFSVERYIATKLMEFNNSIKSIYVNVFVVVNESINKYFNQLDYIEQLKESDTQNQHYKLLYEKTKNNLQELQQSINIKIDDDGKYEKIKVLSYYKFDDHSRVIIDKDIEYTEQNKDNIHALITLDGYSAGIVLNKEDNSVAYLNQNKKCNYTVFMGKEKTPGITSGIQDDGNMLIKYVPLWKGVEVGDEVITSSMDSIFPYGIKVGKVVEIKVYENMKEVLVSPYAKTLGSRNFYFYSNDNNITSN